MPGRSNKLAIFLSACISLTEEVVVTGADFRVDLLSCYVSLTEEVVVTGAGFRVDLLSYCGYGYFSEDDCSSTMFSFSVVG